jgi:hypothetical protein
MHQQRNHSYIAEALTGLWAMLKYKKFVFFHEFTWLTDCYGVKQLFKAEKLPTHATQR